MNSLQALNLTFTLFTVLLILFAIYEGHRWPIARSDRVLVGIIAIALAIVSFLSVLASILLLSQNAPELLDPYRAVMLGFRALALGVLLMYVVGRHRRYHDDSD